MVCNEVLIKQNIAVVWSVGEIIDSHDLYAFCAEMLFPPCIERIVIDHNPMRRREMADGG
ncbi:hypothetical protein MAXJ12_26758 [Mesorhizobium alhagi CCNWXJ12-2]|uniref:Uncharacterized protein n=1 Tax=Mesorhizobium alhagi CCNWXJ12-2 TaxID=1107882 RepID=H0HYR7_9HYPH|nr:hypothetical protein MAXJ12_26758 [Mesorhizobium alhagi CCNWXJ12-2]